MKFQPLVSWWLLLPYLTAALAAGSWQVWRLRHKGRDIFWKWLRRALLLVLPALVAIGPSIQGGTSAPGIANLDVFFVVDNTPSMGALDYAGKQQRIVGIRQDMALLADSLPGAHLEIISFDTEASVILPLTTDSTAFASAVAGMTPQISSYSQGSTIDKPVNSVVRELKNSAAAYPEHFRLLFYLGDGEQTADAPVGSFATAARYVDGGAVLGYGTAKGAQIIKYSGVDTGKTSASYITTIDSASGTLTPAVSKLDAAALQRIAAQLKLTYHDRDQGGAINDVYQASKLPLVIDRSQHVIHYFNLYWLAAVPYASLLFWEWQDLMLKLFALRDQRDPREQRDGPEKTHGGKHA